MFRTSKRMRTRDDPGAQALGSLGSKLENVSETDATFLEEAVLGFNDLVAARDIVIKSICLVRNGQYEGHHVHRRAGELTLEADVRSKAAFFSVAAVAFFAEETFVIVDAVAKKSALADEGACAHA